MRYVEIGLFETVTDVSWFGTNAYCFRPERGWWFVQKFCFWILRRLRCDYYEEVSSVRRIRVDTEDLARKFCVADREIWGRCGRRPEVVYMGCDDFERFSGEDPIHSPFQFGIRLGCDGTYFGVPVRVIPWMSGILVI